MATERLTPRGFGGLLERVRRFIGHEAGNRIRAASIRRRHDLGSQARREGEAEGPFGIAIVAIFRGEDEYLREWVEFHRVVGVEHFFLYDNGDSAASRAILRPYIDEGLVTYAPFPDLAGEGMRDRYGKDQFRKLSMQNLAYGDCARKYARRCRWLVKIDLDEFIYPLEPFASLGEAFSRLETQGARGFSVSALRFGPSGRLERSGRPVIGSYAMRYPEEDRNWKAVGQGSAVSVRSGYHGAHGFFWRPFLRAPFLDDEQTRDLVRINHYYVKSRAEYFDKIERHSVGHKAGKDSADKWPLAEAEARIPDEGSILRFLSALEARLGEGTPPGTAKP